MSGRANRLAPVLLAAALLPATMPIASASFTQRLGVDAGVSVAGQAGNELPTGPSEAPVEPVVPQDTGTAPTGEPATRLPEETPEPRARARADQEAGEACPQTGCAQGAAAPPPAIQAPTPGDAPPPERPAADQSPEEAAAAAQADVLWKGHVRPQ